MPKRSHTTGSITRLPDGRFRVRAARQPDGTRPSLGFAATEEEALALLALDRKTVFQREGCPTFEAWVDVVLEQREGDDVRGIRQERSRANSHLKTAHFAKRPIDQVKPADILQWIRALKKKQADDRREKRKVAHSTVARCFSLASVTFQAAVGIHIDTNPCNGLEVKKDTRVSDDEDREEAWDWLRLEEQKQFANCESVPEWARLLTIFAWGTGLRQGEQWNLKWQDVHDEVKHPYVFVRVGSKGKRPKSGKTRRVALFGDALLAIRRWRQILPSYLTDPRTRKRYTNEHGLVWPTPRGCRRQSGAPEKSVRLVDGRKVGKVELLPEWLKAAGISREMRWHDLRHTFCSSLASGVWGAAWTLEEIKDAAGHSSVTVTEKYAHLCETTQQKAVARMGQGLDTGPLTNGGGSSSLAAILSEFDALEGVGRPGHDPGTYGLKVPGILELLRALASEKASNVQSVSNQATVPSEGAPIR